MTREDLSTKQAGKIYDALMPTLGFLIRLEARLLELGFSDADSYLEKVKKAQRAFSVLAVDTHVLKSRTAERVGEEKR